MPPLLCVGLAGGRILIADRDRAGEAEEIGARGIVGPGDDAAGIDGGVELNGSAEGGAERAGG